jgi:hypothetical protein
MEPTVMVCGAVPSGIDYNRPSEAFAYVNKLVTSELNAAMNDDDLRRQTLPEPAERLTAITVS